MSDGQRKTCHKERGCKAVANQRLDVNTPVRIEPFVHVGNPRIDCEKPRICSYAEDNCKRVCEFVIKQTINVEIPIRYDVYTDIGESFVDCDAECD